jgi:hypothetical protein
MLKANFETRKSHFRLKGWQQALSSYGVLSPTAASKAAPIAAANRFSPPSKYEPARRPGARDTWWVLSKRRIQKEGFKLKTEWVNK